METIDSPKIQALLQAIYAVNYDILDYWEITAIIESLGYPDRVIQQEFGYPDSLSLGKYLYQYHQSQQIATNPPVLTKSKFNLLEEIYTFITEFSHSFVYTVPFIVLLFFDYYKSGENDQVLPPQLSALFTIATMASLITSGGFVQMISRRGTFYNSLGDRITAQRVCLPILAMGIITTIICGFFGIFIGFYSGVFIDDYVIIASIYYLFISIIWLIFGIVSTQFKILTPSILISISILFAILRLTTNMGAIAAQSIMMGVALIILIIFLIISLIKYRVKKPPIGENPPLPNLSSLVYLLAPYFGYGLVYFSFIFADRLAAGFSVSKHFDLVFAIDINYQRHMDLSLLNFLLLVPFIEYLSFKFIKSWYSQIKIINVHNVSKFKAKLARRYWQLITLTIVFFILLFTVTIALIKLLNIPNITLLLIFSGCLGYLLFSIGLFNVIILFSLDHISTVVNTITPASIINFFTGYIFANLFGVNWASFGLITGSIYLLTFSTRAVLSATKKPDYCYFNSGY